MKLCELQQLLEKILCREPSFPLSWTASWRIKFWRRTPLWMTSVTRTDGTVVRVGSIIQAEKMCIRDRFVYLCSFLMNAQDCISSNSTRMNGSNCFIYYINIIITYINYINYVLYIIATTYFCKCIFLLWKCINKN